MKGALPRASSGAQAGDAPLQRGALQAATLAAFPSYHCACLLPLTLDLQKWAWTGTEAGSWVELAIDSREDATSSDPSSTGGHACTCPQPLFSALSGCAEMHGYQASAGSVAAEGQHCWHVPCCLPLPPTPIQSTHPTTARPTHMPPKSSRNLNRDSVPNCHPWLPQELRINGQRQSGLEGELEAGQGIDVARPAATC